MPSADRRLELKEKTSMAQNAWQASVYANGLSFCVIVISSAGKWRRCPPELEDSSEYTE